MDSPPTPASPAPPVADDEPFTPEMPVLKNSLKVLEDLLQLQGKQVVPFILNKIVYLSIQSPPFPIFLALEHPRFFLSSKAFAGPEVPPQCTFSIKLTKVVGLRTENKLTGPSRVGQYFI